MTWGEARTASAIPAQLWALADSRPEAVAIAGAGAPVTYGELWARAAGYAQLLPEPRPTPPLTGGVAALLLDHGPGVIVAAVAALMRGFAVITLNPSEPPSRHTVVRGLVEPTVLVTDAAHLEHARAAGFDEDTLVLLDGGDPEEAAADGGGTGPGPDDVAFLISTSGSTGQPKVVMQTHRNMLHNVLRYTNGLGIEATDRIAWMAALSGGQGLATAWTALLGGATLCPFPIAERGVTGLRGWLEEQGITVLDTVPSVLRNFALTLREERISGIRLVRLASEAALGSDFQAFRRHFPQDCTLATVLGSSEAGIMSQALLGTSFAPGERLPVGVEADGITLRLQTEDGTPAPNGEPGEIVVESRYLAPGYWRDEELTAARFGDVADGIREFRTGDVGLRGDDGMLVIVGRRDSQVKVRGHRLQLEEVESAIAAQAGVAAVAVSAGWMARGDTRLTAYVATTPGAGVTGASLRASLRTVLPPHAVPASIVCVDALPMNAHGKVDRSRLAELEPPAVEGNGDQPDAGRPGSQTEELLATIWREAFDRDDIRRDDPFLELGGDSLTAAVIAAGVHEAFGRELGLSAFASEITIATLAEQIDSGALAAGEDDLPPLRPRRPPPASYAQRFMWHAAQIDPAGLTLATAYRITGQLDVAALRRALEQLVARHEALRTMFAEIDEVVVQLIASAGPVELPLFDFREDADPRRRAADLLALEARRSFELERGPLVRFALARTADEEHHLLRINHHLVADAPSWQIFFDELALAYEAHRTGGEMVETQPPLQYADFAAWEWAVMQRRTRPAYHAELDWWERQLADPAPRWWPGFQRPERLQEDPGGPGMVEWGLAPDRAHVLDQIGRDGGSTYYMTRLAAFSALLALQNGVDDVLLESFFSTRRRVELQRMIGVFINRTLLRLRLPEGASFRTWLAEVRRTVIETSAHASIPQMQLRHELAQRGAELPMTRIRFAALYQLPRMQFGGLTVDRLPREQLAPRGFVLGVDRNYDATGCRAVFDPRNYDPVLVAAFIDRLQGLVAAICAQPDAPLSELHESLRDR